MQIEPYDWLATELPAAVSAWRDRFRAACDDDEELQAHGRFFSCAFLLDMEERRVYVRMDAGRVAEILIDPGPLDVRYEFAIRASPETWLRFATPTPPPMYHGIWAATFRRDMKLDGDLLVLMQNLRAVTRQLELLRQTGVPLEQARQ